MEVVIVLVLKVRMVVLGGRVLDGGRLTCARIASWVSLETWN
jgi:hypothetical protein